MVLNVQRRRDVKHLGHYRCLLNGVDVTNRAFYADGRRGVVRMYAVNEDGDVCVDQSTHDVVRQERRGHVRLIRRAA